MRCPSCQRDESRVVDSRTTGDSIRRRRQCAGCGARFTTHERLEQRVLWVLKKGGVRERFSRDKVLRGVTLACRKRPIEPAVMEAVVDAVESALDGEAEVPSSRIGDAVLRELRRLDLVAAVRFASVYQEFESVEQFVDAVAPLQDPT